MKKLIILIIFSILCLALVFNRNDMFSKKIEYFKSSTKDDCVYLEWHSLLDIDFVKADLKIYNKGSLVDTVNISKYINFYNFKNGKHGLLYDFVLEVFYDSEQKTYCSSSMFLDFNSLPDIPVIFIETENGLDPTCDIVYSSYNDNLFSSSNKNLIHSTFVKNENGNHLKSTCNVSIRGNSSLESNKKSYNLIFDDNIDLLSLGPQHKSKRYALLANQGVKADTPFSNFIARKLGLEYTPSYKYVNLFLNNDYKGCYILSETVEKSETRVNISDSGFIVENDAYFWNEDKYFKTKNQVFWMGYTIKYPGLSKITDGKITNIKSYFDTLENSLYTFNPNINQYIDYDTFSSWLLVHDIIGNSDSAGSNMFLYKYDFEEKNEASSKIKLGPAWDFDAAFMCNPNEWSPIHTSNIMYFDKLLMLEDFRKIVIRKIEDIEAKGLLDELVLFTNEFRNMYCEEIQESIELEQQRYDKSLANFNIKISNAASYLKNRIEWIIDNKSNLSQYDIKKIDENHLSIGVHDSKYQNVSFAVFKDLNDPNGVIWHDGTLDGGYWRFVISTDEIKGHCIHIYDSFNSDVSLFIGELKF